MDVTVPIVANVDGADKVTVLADAVQKVGDNAAATQPKLDGLSSASAKWTDSQQRAAQAMAGLQEQALKMNEALGEQAGALEVANEALREFAPQLSTAIGLLGGMAAAGLAFEGVKEAIGEVAEFTVQAVEHMTAYAASLEKMHASTRIGVDSLQILRVAATGTNTSFDDAAAAVSKMEKNLGEGSTAFARLGLDLQTLKSEAPERAFEDVAKAIRNLPDAYQAAAAASEIFGKSYTTVMELIQKGDMGAAAEEAQRLGIVLGTEDVEAAVKFEEQVKLLGLAWEGAKNEFAAGLVETGLAQEAVSALTEAAGGLSTWVRDNKDGLSGLFSALGISIMAAKGDLEAFIAVANAWTGGTLAVFLDQIKNLAEEGKHLKEVQDQLRAADQQALATTPYGQSIIDAWMAGEGDPNKAGHFTSKPDDAAQRKAEADAARTQQLLDKEMDEIQSMGEYARTAMAERAAAQAQLAEQEQEEIQGMGEFARAAMEARAEAAAALAESEAEEIKRMWHDSMQEAAREHKKFIDEAVKDTQEWYSALSTVLGALGGIGGAFGDIISGLSKAIGASEQLAVNMEKAGGFGNMSSGQKAQAVASGIGLGVDAYNYGGENGAGAGALHGAASGAMFGMAFGPMGAAIGAAVGGIVGLLGAAFGKPEYKAAMEDVGKNWGVAISDGLAKAIAATETKDNLSRTMAELLHVADIMGESGADPSTFSGKIGDLMNAVALGTVPAKEGIDELSKAFGDLQTAAQGGSVASEAAMIQMIQRARELGQSIPALDAAVKGFRDQERSGFEAFLAGLTGDKKGQVTPEQMAANEQLFGAVYQAQVAELGLMDGAEAMRKSFEDMVSKMPKGTKLTGDAAEEAHILELLKDKGFAGAASGAKGLADMTKGALDAGDFTDAMNKALSTSTMTLYNQALAAQGATEKDALEAIMPEIIQLQHAQELGQKLTPDEQKLLDAAKKDNLLPLKTLAEQSLDVEKGILAGINHLAGISAGDTGGSSGSGGGGGAVGGGASGGRGGGAGSRAAAMGAVVSSPGHYYVGEGGSTEVIAPVAALFHHIGKGLAASGGRGHTFNIYPHPHQSPNEIAAHVVSLLDGEDPALTQRLDNRTRRVMGT